MIKLIETANAGVIASATPITTVAMNVLNFLLSVTLVVAIIAMTVAGMMYFGAIGDEKNMQLAKKYFQYSCLGIALGLGGMILIKTIGMFFQ
jgi:drug/metabolite transporter (DMT)-like permease